MRILVTGAAGFVGAHLVRGLGEAYPDAVIMGTDLLTWPVAEVERFWRPVALRIEKRSLDVTDAKAVEAMMAAFRPTNIVHMAAVTPTLDDERDCPAAIVEVNVGGTLAVMDAATRLPGIHRVVVVSSGAVLGPAASFSGLVDEEVIPNPATLYGVTKLAGEGIALRLGALRGVSVVAVRLASVFGSMERPTRARQRTSLIHRLASAEGKLTVSGLDVIRDWVHADDVALAIAALLRAPFLRYGLYNIGGGEPVGWRRIVEAFRTAGRILCWADAGAQIVAAPSDARPVFSIARLAEEVGFRPRPVENGIADLLAALKVHS